MNQSIEEILEIAEKAVAQTNPSNLSNSISEANFQDTLTEIKAIKFLPKIHQQIDGLICKKKCFEYINKGISATKFINEAFDAHNEYRRKHGIEPLSLNSDIAFIAEQYAKKMAKTGRIVHSNNKFMNQDLGENIYSFDFRDQSFNGKKVTDEWYNEMYNFKFSGAQNGTGHFTQLIWKSTKQVGFGLAFSPIGRAYFVANYFPSGNIIGEFDKNVNQPLE